MTEIETKLNRELNLDFYADKRIKEYLSLDSKCERVAELRNPIETMVLPEDLEIIDDISGFFPYDYLNKVLDSHIDSLEVGEVLLVHETRTENLTNILEDGFSVENANTRRESAKIRENRIFAWLHRPDVGEHIQDPNYIITKADIDDVIVSSYLNVTFLDEELITEKQYKQDHIFSLREYIECLLRGFNPEGRTLKNMIGIREETVNRIRRGGT